MKSALSVVLLATGSLLSACHMERALTFKGQGTLLDFTNNTCTWLAPAHCDRRIPAPSLGPSQRRDVYIYLPAGYPQQGQVYPVIYALHGYGGDESSWAAKLPEVLDDLIFRQVLPPVVVVMPDFSLTGRPSGFLGDGTDGGSFYINSNRGRFEDYFLQDLVPFVRSRFAGSTDPRATVLLGSSMGGFGVFNLGLKHPELSTLLAGIYPAVDLRFSCNGNSAGDYQRDCYQPRTSYPAAATIAVFGPVRIPASTVLYPVFDSDQEPGPTWTEDRPMWERIAAENPRDLLEGRDLSPYRMILVVGDRDEFNIDAEVASFVDALVQRGFTADPAGRYIRPGGHHNGDFERQVLPEVLEWIGKRLYEACAGQAPAEGGCAR
ncbi:MAG: alpha/beta fold hydrolase [Deinococcus sp.]|nr:alpha/beta fold hydrolase [Deinococcus sp.]